jgi:peptidoglycan/LPS O-acetylase OafA/YrhL
MQCRNCGTEIAAQALICYKCGTATTEAKYQPPALRRQSRSALVATVLGLALLVVLALFMGRLPNGDIPRAVTWTGVAVAVLVVGLRAYARRR